MARKRKMTDKMLQQKVSFIERTAAAYRQQAERDGIRVVSQDEWAARVRARIHATEEGKQA